MKPKKRTVFVWGILGSTVIVHLVGPGRFLKGEPAALYSSYFSDIVLPFCFYYVVSIAEKLRIPRTRIAYFLFVLAVCAAAEVGQYFGLPILGRTFDACDFIAYLLGSALALLSDYIFFKDSP